MAIELYNDGSHVCLMFNDLVDDTGSSAVQANVSMGWKNVMWGSDYPHYEGTYGHTQKTLHELFDDVDAETTYRIRVGAFKELFPFVPDPPADGTETPA